MPRIRMLGGAVVEGDAGPLGGAVAQRKSLAVLGLLVPVGDRGMSRDKILAYLWPEVGLAKAAHRLTQVLYALRRDLGAEDLFLGASELRLNPERISSDVREFILARQTGDLERAANLYEGPFLDGFFLDGAPEFGAWIENERAGFAQQLTETLETLAAEATAKGDARRAAQWWQRLAVYDPLSSRVTAHLMSALAAAGDRVEALERARSYQAFVERELQAEPNPAILALADQLKRRPSEGLIRRTPAVKSAVSVGVLPFANLSPLGANDYFVEGLAEEVRSGLAGLAGVRVAARISTSALRQWDLDARAIGSRLGVGALLEGSARQAGGQLRVSVQLIDTSDGCHLWSQKYQRTVTEAFSVQDELADLIVKGVEQALAARDEPTPGTTPNG